MFLSKWREFSSAPCLAGEKKNLMTARVAMMLKSRASLASFRACFLPGRAKDLSAPRYIYETDVIRTAFTLQQLLHERATILGYTFVRLLAVLLSASNMRWIVKIMTIVAGRVLSV